MWKELIDYLLKNKKWWLIPSILIFIIFGIMIIFSQTSPVSAFVYMLF
jgi:F0F1-type ATP synthase assembly protein I